MPSLIHAAIYAAVIGGTVTLGGWGIYSISNQMPKGRSLVNNEAYEQKAEGKSETFASLTGNVNYLIDPDSYNENWWNWSYKNRWLNATITKHSDFQQVERGYADDESGDSDKALNQICKKQYTKGMSGFTDTNTRSNLEENIARFCSVSGDVKTLSKFLNV